MVGRLIVNRMETNQHESNKKAVSPVRSIQHVSHQHTGDIGASLQEEYFLYDLFKGCKRVTVRAAQSCGRAQMRLRRIFPGFRLLEPTSSSCCWTRSSCWHWHAPEFGFEPNQSILNLFEKTTFSSIFIGKMDVNYFTIHLILLFIAQFIILTKTLTLRVNIAFQHNVNFQNTMRTHRIAKNILKKSQKPNEKTRNWWKRWNLLGIFDKPSWVAIFVTMVTIYVFLWFAAKVGASYGLEYFYEELPLFPVRLALARITSLSEYKIFSQLYYSSTKDRGS